MALPEPPQPYQDFLERFPELGSAWEQLRQGGQGDLEERPRLLLKLAVAIGGLREGAVRAAARKGLAAGIELAELEQIAGLAASTIGLPSAVAAFSWIRDAAK